MSYTISQNSTEASQFTAILFIWIAACTITQGEQQTLPDTTS